MAASFVIGHFAEYLGGDPGCDSKGFIKNMRYDIICYNLFQPQTRGVVNSMNEIVRVVDENGNLTGKAMYFTVTTISSWDYTWRKGVSVIDQQCDHDWKTYIGFSETYDYCSKCDIRR
jgi:hypothetical protein